MYIGPLVHDIDGFANVELPLCSWEKSLRRLFFFFFCKVFLPLFKRTEENLTVLTWAGCCMFLACFFRVTVLQTFKIWVFFSR